MYACELYNASLITAIMFKYALQEYIYFDVNNYEFKL